MLGEFAYDNSYQPTISMTPFEALYGRPVVVGTFFGSHFCGCRLIGVLVLELEKGTILNLEVNSFFLYFRLIK